VEYFAAAHARLVRVRVLRKIPVGIVDLEQVMPHVADESRALALAFELEEHVARRMARRGIDLDEFVQPISSAADQVGVSMLENGDHALAKRSQLRRAFLWIGVDLRKIVDVGL